MMIIVRDCDAMLSAAVNSCVLNSADRLETSKKKKNPVYNTWFQSPARMLCCTLQP